MNKPNANLIETSRWGWLILFASSATLICCALPIVLVTLGLGAVSATLFSSLPFLVTLAQYKLFIFIASGALLGVSGWFIFRPNRSCPVDPKLAALCEQAHRFNKRIWLLSCVLWLAGFTAAYLALPILNLLNA